MLCDLLLDIKPQGNVSSKIKEQLHVLSPFGSDNIQEEHRINAPIQTIEEMEHILGIISSTEMENHTASKNCISYIYYFSVALNCCMLYSCEILITIFIEVSFY